MTAGTCPRRHGSGWVCEMHRRQPMDHTLEDGCRCPGPGAPCEEPDVCFARIRRTRKSQRAAIGDTGKTSPDPVSPS